MEAGTRVWVRDHHGSNAWIAGTVARKVAESKDEECVLFVECENTVIEVKVLSEHEESADIKLRNSSQEGHVENLINLPFLNEPAILHCLQVRYDSGLIYTYTGPILIAVNPFKRVELYTKSILDEYYNKGLLKAMGADVGTHLAPHVYAIADNAYRQMMSAIVKNGVGKSSGGDLTPDQSILISGESGAGKTESTKVVLSYLTTVGSAPDAAEGAQNSIMDKVLQSNPILEAFGNAKTKRNDNSSRFGKFIQLSFNRRGHLIGGSIKTYLLEKVRLPFQQVGERNFHIFYQMFSGSDVEEKSRRGLTNAEDFSYVSKSGLFRLASIDDAHEFDILRSALQTLRFSEDDRQFMFDIVGGVLHIGQLVFQSTADREGEGSKLVDSEANNFAVSKITQLLGLSSASLLEVLTVRQIVAAGETYMKKLTCQQACDARDAIAKSIYGRLFDWIVQMINSSIEVDKKNVRATIGVLDIFGFESFAINSFEQLCINYANETLQQQFNQFIFKLEQAEYDRERIQWSFIQFPDNKDCLELIEHKINGIIAMLDDECRLPKSSDDKFAGRMYKEYSSHARFSASAHQKRAGKFCVNHYAGSVEYTVASFVEKNKDELPKEASSLLQGATNPILQRIFQPPSHSSPDGSEVGKKGEFGTAQKQQVSVGGQFKEQLHQLMATIYSTLPHYIRCLKPNDQNVPDNFARLRITEQLRYGGVLEAVRVARSGFPVRLPHEEFLKRYGVIIHLGGSKTQSIKEICEETIRTFLDFGHSEVTEPKSKRQAYSFNFKAKVEKDGFQVGLTKVFLRKDCHDFLETARYRCQTFAATSLQGQWRCCTRRMHFQRIRCATLLMQRFYRGFKARAHVRSIRERSAATRMQACARRFTAQRKFFSIRWATVRLQACWRGRVSQRSYVLMRMNIAARKLSAVMRMLVCRQRFRSYKWAVVKLQTRKRMRSAIRALRAEKAKAKDLGVLQQSNEVLRKEIEMLKARAMEEKIKTEQEGERKAREAMFTAQTEEMAKMSQKVVELEELLKLESRAKEEAEQKAALSAVSDNSKLCRKCRERPVDTANAGESDHHRPVRRMSGEHSRLSPMKSPSAHGKHMPPKPEVNHAHEEENSKLRAQNAQQLSTIEELRMELERMKQMASASHAPPVIPATEREIGRPKRVSFKQQRRPSKSTESPREIPDSRWGSVWDAEDDDNNSEASLQEASSTSQSESPVSLPVEHVPSSLEKNVDKWKGELMKGVKASFWEVLKPSRMEITLKLDTSGTTLQFIVVQQRRGFSLFNTKVEIAPLKLQEITECVSGAELKVDPSETKTMMTIIAKEHFGSPRVVVLQLASIEEKNVVLSKLRAIVASVAGTQSTSVSSAMAAAVSTQPEPARRGSIGVSYDALGAKSDASGIEGANPLFQQRAVRRQSLRESIISKNLQGPSETVSGVVHSTSSVEAVIDDGAMSKLHHDLREERHASQSLKRQLAVVNNDLAEREELIAQLKKSQGDFEARLKEKDNVMKQDTMVRLQLGKRLEQVLMDKEEALEQLEQLKAQLDMLTRR